MPDRRLLLPILFTMREHFAAQDIDLQGYHEIPSIDHSALISSQSVLNGREGLKFQDRDKVELSESVH